ncbi:MAG TPA: hypothetical protein VHG90_05625, partial [Acidimicrobiales bacterium]|nr:hypothetical protein [Acidimicrobiales bacterium]
PSPPLPFQTLFSMPHAGQVCSPAIHASFSTAASSQSTFPPTSVRKRARCGIVRHGDLARLGRWTWTPPLVRAALPVEEIVVFWPWDDDDRAVFEHDATQIPTLAR